MTLLRSYSIRTSMNPVERCSNGKWRIADGPCVYVTKNEAEEVRGAEIVVVDTITVEVDLTAEPPTYTRTSSELGVIVTRDATDDEILEAQTKEEQVTSAEQAAAARDAIKSWMVVLEQWKTDADTVVAAWDTATNVQKDQWMKTTIRRFGLLASHVDDLVRALRIGDT